MTVEGTRLGHVASGVVTSDEALTLFKDFTGGPPDVAPLLQRRGLAPGGPAAAGSSSAANEVAPPASGVR